MADKRHNQAHGYYGAPPTGPGLMNMTTMRGTYIQSNLPVNPMMQQQMMMRFPMQGMRMGVPNTPPPPYSVHQAPGVTLVNQPRSKLSNTKGAQPKSEKERFFEEQRQKLRQFGKPGSKKVDTDSLIGSIFKVEPKPPGLKSKGDTAQKKNMDDGFGEFLQGPATDQMAAQPEPVDESSNTLTDAFEESSKVAVEEKKDLTSMMLECSDLSAPQKAKGFHKPTLNEVHRSKQHDGHRRPSFHHDSDQSISWKSAKDLDGLFQLPPDPGPLPHHPRGPPPSGPPPTYGEATASSSESIPPCPAVNQASPAMLQAMPPPNSQLAQASPSPGPTPTVCLPDWCAYDENQVPPVYKQILEASLVDGKIATDRLYPILLLSGLPREKLAHLWSLCNTGTPGLLIKTELWLILALIALTQNNYDTSRVDILYRCPAPPIPSFAPSQNSQPALLSTSQHLHATPPRPPPAAANNLSSPSAQQAATQLESQNLHPMPDTTRATNEDDFADFQTAPSGSSQALATLSCADKDMRQEDSFGDFIGGESSSSGISSGRDGGRVVTALDVKDSDPLDFPPYLPPRHCGESRSSASGNSHHAYSCPPSQQMNSQQKNQHQSHNNFPLHHYHHHNHSNNHENYHHNRLNNQSQPPPPQPPLPSSKHRQSTTQPSHSQYQGTTLYQHGGSLYSNDSMDNPAANRLSTSSSGTTRPPPQSDNFESSLNAYADLPHQALPPICPEVDKYSGNVRSFFGGSDSSTGHTSPSFEDDDLTDGRDSFSQVSTSEQSEVDDIHNFEHYVEEFNHRKKQAPGSGSPLHCPFPSVQNNALDNAGQAHNVNAQQAAGDNEARNPDVITDTAPSKLKSVQIPPALGSFNLHTTSQKPSSSASSSASATAANHKANDAHSEEDGDFGDFADFKSASSSTSTPSTTTIATASQNNADDRYGALRDLTQEMDLMQSSVFADSESSKSSAGPNLHDAAAHKNGESIQDDEDEEWANFTDATVPTSSLPNFEVGEGNEAENQNDNHFVSPPGMLSSNSESGVGGGGGNEQHQTAGDLKGGILKLFQVGSTSTPTLSNDDNSAMVKSDSGYSTRSWGRGGGSDAVSTPSMFDITPSSPYTGDAKPGDGSAGNQDTSFWNGSQITDSGIETNWASFGGQAGVATHLGQSSSPLPAFSMAEPEKQDGEDDWGDFSTMTTTNNATLQKAGDNEDGHGFDSSMGLTNPMPTSTMDIQAFGSNKALDWGNCNDAGGTSAHHNSSVGISSSDAVGVDDNETNFVTIKKQNLGTNEIMGLFKVRDDPATMSGYQLPPNETSPSFSSAGARKGQTGAAQVRKSRGRSRGQQASSDFDDDIAPPPLDSDGDDDDDGDNDQAFSRGYDLDDFMQRQPPATSYSLFGSTTSSPVYSRTVGKTTLKLKDSKEDTGSVNSLELPSASQSFEGVAGVLGGDDHSVSSLEQNTGGNSGAMVSAESKSLDSLDFKTNEFPLEPADEAGKEDMPAAAHQPEDQEKPHASHSSSNPHHVVQPQDLLASMPSLVDKYNIDGMVQGNHCCSREWERCLEQCSQVLTQANTIFNNISSSAVCNEILKSLQGWEYVSCVIEIYRVACRVMTSIRSTAISSNELEQSLKDIDLMWNNLSAFLVGASLLPDPSSLVFTSAVLKSDHDSSASSSSSSSVNSSSACGICLLNVDVPPTTTSSSSSSSSSLSSPFISSLSPSSSFSSTLSSVCIDSSINTGIISKLSFAGRHYHSICANFWVNRVDQTLPSLVLPELI